PDEAMAHLPAGADVFVMNSNYLDEIEALTARRFKCLTIERGSPPGRNLNARSPTASRPTAPTSRCRQRRTAS
ncbi:MAG: hypothetical protein ACXWUL_06155, partial [Caldimonas sp.]